ncbi:hypothetical protein [Aquipseudomonas alcaligenes]|uniref:Lipoprotein n=1 Tax=Aquipseudomonas alcaligenes (strain ATCC 14909 / DSM 50342 / CCUG 1425 / JCM 20561 / NBRC 14159 / NCIMB 9945 / NCTC 10367 / 1577) TaxID=1215092 RepID=U3AXY7_AQUA1|nr:hypothetical protein [Pseudomonas alcaligenes]GAD62494.1 hypothetical protein PA6_012_00870 [Pseudomonas alcaligenes NBRC 14159]SUD17403.1 Uncharacterised protein [Pseudomonas alcaligenes]
MHNKIVAVAFLLASLMGCASRGSVPASDPRYPKMTECGADLVVFIASDTVLTQRVERDLRTGPLPAPMQLALEDRMKSHPSAGYVEVVFSDVGSAALNRNLNSVVKPKAADMMANSELKFANDKIKALQEIVPQLAESAQSSCKQAGYSFTAIKPLSVILVTEEPKVASATPSTPQQVSKHLSAEPEPHKSSPAIKRSAELPAASKAEPKPVKAQPSIRVRKASQSERVQLAKSVGSALKDADSAKYAEMDVIPKKFACVSVNAKNSFGGYTGFKSVLVAYIDIDWFYLQEVGSHSLCHTVMTKMARNNS